MTAEIAHCILDVLQPRGVAVVVEAEHLCISSRGVDRPVPPQGHQPDARPVFAGIRAPGRNS